MVRTVVKVLWMVLAVAAVGGLTCVCVVAPAAGVAREVALGLATQPPPEVDSWLGLARSLGVSILSAALIALGACTLALVVCNAAAQRPSLWTPLLLVPLLLPSYLAYAGWGLIRAPGTIVGDFLARGPSTGPNWWPVAASKSLAIVGLSAWAYPICVAPLVASIRSGHAGVLDAMRLDCRGPRLIVERIRMHARAIAVGFLAVWTVMLGSAVPLHVAQLETAAIAVWLTLDSTPTGRQWVVWVIAAPLVLLAGVGAVCAAWTATDVRADGEAGGRVTQGPRSVLDRVSPLLPVACAGVPIAAFALSLASWSSVELFVRLNQETIVASAAVAAIVGGLGALVGVVFAWSASVRSRLAVTALVILSAGAVCPGVLVGQATAQAWRVVGLDQDWWAWPALVCAHAARFLAIAALVGWWWGARESREVGDQRRLDGARDLWSWVATTGGGAPLLAGLAGGVCAALSLHEIESSIILQPIGVQSLPRVLLAALHFARTEELASGVLVMVSLGAGPAVVASVLARTLARMRPRIGAGTVGATPGVS